MIDIETLDVEITAAVIGIGAVVFDPRGETVEDTYQVIIDAESNKRHGRTVSKRTLEWWAQQSPEARAAVFDGKKVHFQNALIDFVAWICKLQPTCTRVWANSPDFDCSILAHACKELGIIWPFKFWETRCVRTVKELAYPEGDFPHVEMDGPAHEPLADAKKQVIQVQHSFYVLGV